MILPDTLPLMLGQGNDETISKILSNPEDHLENILLLSRICKVKITFNAPFTLRINRRCTKLNVTEYIFSGFFKHGNDLCYTSKRDGRHGQFLPMSLIKSYEPIRNKTFKIFEQFKKKFDPYFITDEYIMKLWEETSCQTGERYTPADFHQISPAGKHALQSFLVQFKGVSNLDPSSYSPRSFDGKSYHMAKGHYFGSGNGNFSKDVTIEHKLGKPIVHYHSEQTGGGKSRSGLVVSKSTYLWTEDD